MYYALKHLHVTAASLSILFFVIRAYWSVSESPWLQRKFVRIAPHIIDTIFLLAGLGLAGFLGAAAAAPWLYTKIILLIVYIVVGTYAIKRGPTPTHRGIAAIIAVLVFLYIVGVALNHNPASWFA